MIDTTTTITPATLLTAMVIILNELFFEELEGTPAVEGTLDVFVASVLVLWKFMSNHTTT